MQGNKLIPERGMVLAAGLGTRMRPLTDSRPKPMIEVAGHSMLDRAIAHLEHVGVTTIVVNTSYKADMFEAHLAHHASSKIVFSREPAPLETGGGIHRALHHFDSQPFYVVNGDIVWIDGATSALSRLASAFEGDLDALLLLHPVNKAIGYDGPGNFNVRENGTLERRADNKTAPYVYTGVQLLHPRLFQSCPEGAFSLNVLYDRAIGAHPPRIKGIVHDGEWLHIGDPQALADAEAYLLRHNC